MNVFTQFVRNKFHNIATHVRSFVFLVFSVCCALRLVPGFCCLRLCLCLALNASLTAFTGAGHVLTTAPASVAQCITDIRHRYTVFPVTMCVSVCAVWMYTVHIAKRISVKEIKAAKGNKTSCVANMKLLRTTCSRNRENSLKLFQF